MFLDSKMIEHNAKYNNSGLFSPQINWLDHPQVNLLNYADFNNEMKKMCDLFEVSPDKPLPTKNVGIKNTRDITIETVTSDQINRIKQYCKCDYDFFDSKGITF